MELAIIRTDDTFSSRELIDQLEALDEWDSSVQLDIRSSTESLQRALDPTIVVAIVSGSATLIATLISQVAKIAEARGKQKVVIELSDGRHIEVEGKNATEEVTKLLASLEETPNKLIV